MNKSDSIVKLSQALLKAQKSMGAAVKDAANPFFRSKYADYGAVLEACKDPLNEAGVVILQPQFHQDGRNFVSTMLVHSDSGEFISSNTEVVCKEANNPQALGSAITYARRYGLQSLLSLPTEDDDGNAGSGKAYTPPAKAAAPKAATPAPTKAPEAAKPAAVVASAPVTEVKKETPKAQPAVAAKVQAGW